MQVMLLQNLDEVCPSSKESIGILASSFCIQLTLKIIQSYLMHDAMINYHFSANNGNL